MTRRSSFAKPNTIDLRGVLGTFKVPNARLTVEYFLTYASLDASEAEYGELLDLLVPVREVFNLDDLSFEQLLQRDLDDFRVSNDMVPYLLGDKPSDPRFFPPIVAVIVPLSNGTMDDYYPELKTDTESEDGFNLHVSKYGSVFSVKREMNESGDLSRSPVDLIIHPANAKLVIVDGQHRAMAMLATYRSAFNKWSGNEFKYFYERLDNLDAGEKTSLFNNILLPICIVYFPELTKDIQVSNGETNLTRACRKLFLDVNRNARQPSQARQILLDDTDLAAFFTRLVFNSFQENDGKSGVRLYHTEYDNPHDRVLVNRPLAITDVYTIFSIIQYVLMLDDERVRNPTSTGGFLPQNAIRLQRELELSDVFTQEEQETLKISDIKRYNYPKSIEEKLGMCFEEGWGKAIVTILGKLFPYAKHIEAVNHVLDENKTLIGPSEFAKTALIEGQGLRFTLEKQQEYDKKYRRDHKITHKTDAEKAWDALTKLEEEVSNYRATLYAPIKKGENKKLLKDKTARIYTAFRTNAFQTGLFMAFAYLKGKLALNNQEFLEHIEKWLRQLNARFQNSEKVRLILFDIQEENSLRRLYKPSGGLSPADWTFFRYVTLELLNPNTAQEKAIISDAKTKWRGKLYDSLITRKKKELGEEESINPEQLAYDEMVKVYAASLGVSENDLKVDIRISSAETDTSDESITFETDEEEEGE